MTPTDERSGEHPFFESMRDQFAARPLPAGRWQRFGWRRLHARPVLRPAPLAGAGMVLAVAVAALVIALGAGSSDPAPASAVSLNHHTVTIYWRQWRDVGSLNARLKAFGTRIRVVPIVHGCVAPVHHVVYAQVDSNVATHVARGPARTLEVARPPVATGSGQGGTLTTWNDTLAGRTRIFVVSKSGWTGDVFTVVGPAPRCVGDSPRR